MSIAIAGSFATQARKPIITVRKTDTFPDNCGDVDQSPEKSATIILYGLKAVWNDVFFVVDWLSKYRKTRPGIT